MNLQTGGKYPNVPQAEGIAGVHVQFLNLLDIHIAKLEAGRVVFEMTVDDRHLRTLGIAHGGVTATLIDSALGFAAGTTAPPGFHVVTVQLNLNYVRPAWKGEKLIATGEVVHAGKQTAVSRGEVRSAEGALIGVGQGTFMYIPEPKTPDHMMPKLENAPR
jgi:uncharacterized protein (TIGR00369 family)